MMIMSFISKRLVLPVALALCGLGAFAATPGVTFLFTNGQKVSFAFASKPQIAVTAEGLSVSSSSTATVSYLFADVQKFYFEDDIATAISQVKDDASAQSPVFHYVDGVVSVSGMSAGERLTVVAINGNQLNAAKADGEGKASVDINGAPAGVYIVSTGSGVSFKILKK